MGGLGARLDLLSPAGPSAFPRSHPLVPNLFTSATPLPDHRSFLRLSPIGTCSSGRLLFRWPSRLTHLLSHSAFTSRVRSCSLSSTIHESPISRRHPKTPVLLQSIGAFTSSFRIRGRPPSRQSQKPRDPPQVFPRIFERKSTTEASPILHFSNVTFARSGTFGKTL